MIYLNQSVTGLLLLTRQLFSGRVRCKPTPSAKADTPQRRGNWISLLHGLLVNAGCTFPSSEGYPKSEVGIRCNKFFKFIAQIKFSLLFNYQNKDRKSLANSRSAESNSPVVILTTINGTEILKKRINNFPKNIALNNLAKEKCQAGILYEVVFFPIGGLLKN